MLLYTVAVIAYCIVLERLCARILRDRAKERIRALRAELRATLRRRGHLHV